MFLLFFNFISVAVATDENLPIVNQEATELPSTPFLVSWCEGERCEHQFQKQVVCVASIYSDARLDSKKVGTLNPGDPIETRIYYTKILKLGSYSPSYLSAGEQPRILVSRASDRSWLSFFDHAWDSEIDPKDHVVFPTTEAWAFIKNKKGLAGFVKLEGTRAKPCPFKSR